MLGQPRGLSRLASRLPGVVVPRQAVDDCPIPLFCRILGLPLAQDLPAHKAADWGLIWRAVEDEVLMYEATRICEHFAMAPTQGLALIKQALNASAMNSLDTQLDRERDLQRTASMTPDYVEGVRAFMEKRKANFSGRKK